MSETTATAATAATTPTAGKGLNAGLWVAQLLLAAAFVMAGAMKLTTPIETLRAQMAWIDGPLGGLVRFIGASEVAGGLGLVLPAATRILPKLTPLAALLLTVVMGLAALTHLSLGEGAATVPSLVLGGLSAFVAWGRGVKAPITPRA